MRVMLDANVLISGDRDFENIIIDKIYQKVYYIENRRKEGMK